MTTTFDPSHAAYRDEADVRTELARVQDVCLGCRQCTDLCTSFTSLFELLDRLDQPEAGALTPDQQDRVVDACFHCGRCAVDCPYTPARDAANVDVPRTMLRAQAMRWNHGHVTGRGRRAARTLRHTDRVGRLATRLDTLANRLVRGAPGSRRRRLLAWATGMSAARSLGTFADERFSNWFAARPKITLARPRRSARIYPSCLVEYQATGVGKDLVRVLERNGVECMASAGRCCGAPLLHAGDVEGFATVARRNVRTLTSEVRAGDDIVVPEPGCGDVLRRQYPDHVPESMRADAELVAAHTFDAAEYLMDIHTSDDAVLDTDFAGGAPRSIVVVSSGRSRSRSGHLRSRDLLRLTGARVRVVSVSSGVESPWGLRSDHDDVATEAADDLANAVEGDRAEIVADSSLTAGVLRAATGRRVVHPIQVLARSYGIPADDPE